MTERLLFGLIMALTLVHIGLAALAQDVTAVLLAIVAGFVWLGMEARENNMLTGLFFALFVMLAALGVMRGFPIVLMLILLLGTLAAWDLARLRSRLAAADAEITPMLEQDHLRKLGTTLAVGGGVTLLPLVANIPINFLMLAIMTLVLLVILRRTIRQLRRTES